MTILPDNAAARKLIPAATGFIDYFPDAMIAVAALSRIGNEQHNPGKPLHWDRSKSGDESDCLIRHFVERGTIDTDGVRHSVKVAWRAMALLQKELEAAKLGGTNLGQGPDKDPINVVTQDKVDKEVARPPSYSPECSCFRGLAYTEAGAITNVGRSGPPTPRTDNFWDGVGPR